MKEQDYLAIEAYVQGELSATEASALEGRATTDSAFADALAERQLLNGHLRAAAAEPALRSTLADLSRKHILTGEKSSASTRQTAAASAPVSKAAEATVKPLLPRKNLILPVSLAAAIILLLVFGGRVFFQDQGATYEQFAQHQPLSLTERGDGDNGITRAEAAFNDGRFEEAIAPLRDYVELNKEDARARLALGISYLEAGDNALAVKTLTEVAENGGTVAPYGNWYLALAALYRDDTSAALNYLERIPPGDAYLDERVKELREAL